MLRCLVFALKKGGTYWILEKTISERFPQHDRQLSGIDVESLNQSLGFWIGVGIQL
jgi:hypothetical protein